jgi:hypothetical protein
MQVIRVSGTVKKAEEEIIRRAQESMRRARLDQDGPSRNHLDAEMQASYQLDEGWIDDSARIARSSEDGIQDVVMDSGESEDD